MGRKGKITYVPPIVMIEIGDIMREDELQSQADGFKEMTRYARLGRDMHRAMKLDFTKKKKLPRIGDFDLFPKKRER